MTVIGQFAGIIGRNVAEVVEGDGVTKPWKFAFQDKNGGTTFVELMEADSIYFEYIPLLSGIPAGFNPAGDLVTFNATEAIFQEFPTPPAGWPAPPPKAGVWQIFGWITWTMHYLGTLYPDTTPYAILVDPEGSGAYVAAHYAEISRVGR